MSLCDILSRVSLSGNYTVQATCTKPFCHRKEAGLRHGNVKPKMTVQSVIKRLMGQRNNVSSESNRHFLSE